MKKSIWKLSVAIVLAILVVGLLPMTTYAATPNDIVIGNSYTLQNGDVLSDGLLVIGGNVTLEAGSTVNGDVILAGGSLDAAGTVNGTVAVFGGSVNLAPTFTLNGDFITAGSFVTQDPAAKIYGQTFLGEDYQNLILPNGINLNGFTNSFTRGFDPIIHVGGFFVRLLLWALAAMVVAMFIPTHLTRTSEAAVSQPFISGGLGCLTIIILPIVLVILAITICLIPISLVGALLLVIAWAFGLVTLGLEVGKRISGMFKQEWHPAISAGVGTLALMIVLNGLETFIPCVGWVPKFLAGIVGLGAVLLTQFGSKPYNPTPTLPAAGDSETLPPVIG